jgi:FAD binding domain of DNA photolyase
LGLDWRWGERYFAEQLNDFDLAANNGGWQWASSSGCDAQPYFRIFNPISQSQKFDPRGQFIRRYLPQLAALNDKDIHAPWLAAPLTLTAAGVDLGVNYPRPAVCGCKNTRGELISIQPNAAAANASWRQRQRLRAQNNSTSPVMESSWSSPLATKWAWLCTQLRPWPLA